MNQNEILRNLLDLTAKAVAHYWQTRASQRKKQEDGVGPIKASVAQ